MNERQSNSSAVSLTNGSGQQNEENMVSVADVPRQKSVENLLISSHEVIGTSISSSLSFTAMTLPANSSQQNQNTLSLDPRRISPTSSPQSSPRPSPRQVHKSFPKNQRESIPSSPYYEKPDPLFDLVRLDEHSSHSNTTSSSTTTTSVSSSNLVSSIPELTRSVSQEPTSSTTITTTIISTKESRTKDKESRGSDRTKKKSSWYNVLYPTYKSRNEDFKRIFKDVPNEERLVVDYSCALQKDILVHGRLYVSQNYLCFYANIFRWETMVSIRWKDVTSITKEKTALVIPNAILICTVNEKHFLTSFGTRDKAYLMLFRVWQNALMDQQMSMQEMWQWVHFCYGDELGLTSDDEDYIPPQVQEEDKISNISECYSVTDSQMDEHFVSGERDDVSTTSSALNTSDPGIRPPILESVGETLKNINARSPSSDNLPTDMSDTTESEVEKQAKDEQVCCTANHEGRKVARSILPMHIDQLFTMLFTSSKFSLDFHTLRKTTDIVQTPWQQNSQTNQKQRVLNFTVALTNTMGPKTAQVCETQVMLPCSKPGELYSIDVEAVNSGIPYADSFYITTHYCLNKVGENETSFSVFSNVKYKKSVWGLVKSFIEKNTWSGIEDYFGCLVKALQNECARGPSLRKKGKRRRRAPACPTIGEAIPPRMSLLPATAMAHRKREILPKANRPLWILISLLAIVLVLNIFLYSKLWSIENSQQYSIPDIENFKNLPQTPEEWLSLLQQQQALHRLEMDRWKQAIQAALVLLKKTETSLDELQESIDPLSVKETETILQENESPSFTSEDQTAHKEL